MFIALTERLEMKFSWHLKASLISDDMHMSLYTIQDWCISTQVWKIFHKNLDKYKFIE